MNFGNNLKDLRETRNVTQGQLNTYKYLVLLLQVMKQKVVNLILKN